jgi:hypothetical protein
VAMLARFAKPKARNKAASPAQGSKPARLGTWARLLLRAPQTRATDSAESSAERAADAAVRGVQQARSELPPGNATGVGTPPWGSGRRLSREERQWHEARSGADLGDVRVHEGEVPEQWATALGARAFAFGRDVIMGRGAYAPGTVAGRRLLAHELEHVLEPGANPPGLARVALTSVDFDALADSLHDAMNKGTDEELIYVALQKLQRDRAAIKALKDAYLKRHKADLVTDLESRLSGRGLGLAHTLLGAKGLRVGTNSPGTATEHEALARAVHALIAGKVIDAEEIYAALLPLARDGVVTENLRTTYARLFSKSLEQELAAKLKGAQLAYALYLLRAPAPATPHSPANMSGPLGFGTPPSTALPAAPGGVVSAGTEVPFQTRPTQPGKTGQTGQFGFGVGYGGALSSESRWLQFIERRIAVTKNGKTSLLDKEISSGGGGNTYRLTTDVSAPSWSVDSYDSSDPFFDQTHSSSSVRDASSVAIYDSPAPRERDVKGQFAEGAATVSSVAHFDIYLVRDFSALYHVEIEMRWDYSDPGKRKTTRTVLSAGAVSGLPAALKTALVAKYPAYAYIR